jgi:hypothetical protein
VTQISHYRSITSVIDETGDGDEEREKQKENANLTKMNHQMRQSFPSSLLGKKKWDCSPFHNVQEQLPPSSTS